MDQQLDRRIAECDVKIENCKTRISKAKESGEDKDRLAGRLKDLKSVRASLVKQKPSTE